MGLTMFKNPGVFPIFSLPNNLFGLLFRAGALV